MYQSVSFLVTRYNVASQLALVSGLTSYRGSQCCKRKDDSRETTKMSPSGKGKYVDVPLDSTFPPGWRKEVYKVNGKLCPKWSIWRDPTGKKYFKEATVMAKLNILN